MRLCEVRHVQHGIDESFERVDKICTLKTGDATGCISGWRGGEMGFRHGIGVAKTVGGNGLGPGSAEDA